MAPGAVASDLMQTFQTTGVALGSLAATYYYIYTAMQIPSGVLADTLGPRVSVTIGSAIAGLGSILFGLAPDFSAATLGRFLVGLGVSVVFVGLMRSNAVWFSEKSYGRISGITLLIGNLGSVLAAAPLAVLLDLMSWRQVFVFIGGFSLVMGIVTWLFVRNRPEELGFPSTREIEGLAPHPTRKDHWVKALMTVFRNLAVWPGFWVNFGITGNLFSFAGLWGVPLMRDVFQLERTDATIYTTLALLGFAAGSLTMGWISDHLGRRKPVILGTCVLSIAGWLAFALLPWGTGLSGYMLFSAIGLFAGGFVVTYAAAKEVCAPGSAGMAIALVNTGLFLGAAIMQPAFGAAIDLTWDGTLLDGIRVYSMDDYRNGLWLSVGFSVIALVAATRIRETRCKQMDK
jgi:sugar phosphate permease